jgi:hypothetical protein
MGEGAVFSRANFSTTESNPLFLEVSARIVFQQDAAFSNPSIINTSSIGYEAKYYFNRIVE